MKKIIKFLIFLSILSVLIYTCDESGDDSANGTGTAATGTGGSGTGTAATGTGGSGTGTGDTNGNTTNLIKNTLTIIVDYPGHPDAKYTAMVFEDGELLAQTLPNSTLSGGQGSLDIWAVENKNLTNYIANFIAGDYTLYATINSDGDISLEPEEFGLYQTVNIDGDKTTNINSSNPPGTLLNQQVSTSGLTDIPDKNDTAEPPIPETALACFWYLPGSNVHVAISATSDGFGFSGGSATTNANIGIMAGEYDLECWVDVNNNTEEDIGDYKKMDTNITINGSIYNINLEKIQ
jgi:hypothetical protein